MNQNSNGICKWCHSKNIRFIKTPKSVHYARKDCEDCGRFLEWVRSPNNIDRNKRGNKKSVSQVCVHHNLDQEFCFFCLRKRDRLGWSETLTIDHIQEIDKGGKDEIENMQVLCSACHKLKNWARLYVNWHLNDERDGGETSDF